MQPYLRGKWLPWASLSYSMMYMTRHIDETLKPYTSIFFSNFVWRSPNRDQTFSNTTKSLLFCRRKLSRCHWHRLLHKQALAGNTVALSVSVMQSFLQENGCFESLRNTAGHTLSGHITETLKPHMILFSSILSEGRRTVVKLWLTLIGLPFLLI